MEVLTSIEMFGLKGVDHAGDLTPLQRRFVHHAYWKREEIKTPDFEDSGGHTRHHH